MSVLVFDASYLLQRCIHKMSQNPLYTRKSQIKTSSLLASIRSFNYIVNYLQSIDTVTSVYMCYDSSPDFRKSIFPEYKANRNLHPDSPEYKEYIAEDRYGWSRKKEKDFLFDVSKEFFKALGCHVMYLDGMEGDDVVFRVTESFDDKVYIVSSDKDFLQVVDRFPDRVKLLSLDFKTNGYKIIGAENLETPNYEVLKKIILGDGGDNVPSLASGVGPATAKKIIGDESINKSSLQEFYDSLMESKYAKKFKDLTFDTVDRNSKLVDLTQCPISQYNKDKIMESIKTPAKFDFFKYIGLCEKYELNSLTSIPSTNKVYSQLV